MIQLNLEPCMPPLWAPSGHAQTLLGHLLPSPMLKLEGKRVEIDLPDGDRLVGDGEHVRVVIDSERFLREAGG